MKENISKQLLDTRMQKVVSLVESLGWKATSYKGHTTSEDEVLGVETFRSVSMLLESSDGITGVSTRLQDVYISDVINFSGWWWGLNSESLEENEEQFNVGLNALREHLEFRNKYGK
jgi:hypothetical protein